MKTIKRMTVTIVISTIICMGMAMFVSFNRDEANCTTTEEVRVIRTIDNVDISADEMNEIIQYMDNDILADIGNELQIATPQDYIKAYVERDPSFKKVLLDNFDLKM